MREHPARRSFFVARGRTAAKSCKSVRKAKFERLLLEFCRNTEKSVETFLNMNSSICIAFISIPCYYFLTDSVYTPWHVLYYFVK